MHEQFLRLGVTRYAAGYQPTAAEGVRHGHALPKPTPNQQSNPAAAARPDRPCPQVDGPSRHRQEERHPGPEADRQPRVQLRPAVEAVARSHCSRVQPQKAVEAGARASAVWGCCRASASAAEHLRQSLTLTPLATPHQLRAATAHCRCRRWTRFPHSTQVQTP